MSRSSNSSFQFLLCSLLASITSFSQINPVANKLWVIEKSSVLSVEGKSNINSFSCKINGYYGLDTIKCSSDVTRPVRLSGSLKMDIFKFDCHNGFITKDLRKTLRAEEYPIMRIDFLSLQCMPVLSSKAEIIKGWVDVELAGTKRRFEINYTFSKASPTLIYLNGARSFCFSDFKLVPPRKLAGIIKIKDDFDVKFQLILRPVH